MKKNLTIIAASFFMACLLTGTSLYAQQKASPPKVSKASVNGNDITINYSSPSKKGRVIFGGLEPMGKVWRTGANEATTIELSKDAKIGSLDMKAGKYALFTIPNETEWIIIINSEPKQWGAFKYDKSKDVGRFNVPVINLDEVVERFAIEVNEAGTVSIAWDQTKVEFMIK
ncbi:Protein of unknown function [Reichenbachiella faecimaris]|uniref:DUF2911 domain-containing protein n=1 Tax=Reichenbachiella faecimaris TaxID=692418 RepID=A0A1W2G8X0_REIFA|nr:DUF2911 domain-containing protein [Reichenbachiella faecimaris]SMD33117.1 Protein of unknown function [Reichenbachiella faecimaris]